jgi:hypothetical protein
MVMTNIKQQEKFKGKEEKFQRWFHQATNQTGSKRGLWQQIDN